MAESPQVRQRLRQHHGVVGLDLLGIHGHPFNPRRPVDAPGTTRLAFR